MPYALLYTLGRKALRPYKPKKIKNGKYPYFF